jgi:preprotein translocase subunit YajC
MDGLSGLLPMAAMFGVMYFLILRPQQKEADDHTKMIAGLVRDDRVVTAGGLHGTVVSVAEATVVVSLARGVEVTIEKGSIARKLPAGAAAPASA